LVVSEHGPGSTADPAVPGIGLSRWSIIAIVIVAGVATTLIIGRQEGAEARERQQTLAIEAGVLVDATAERTATAIAGAGGLVQPNGRVERQSFLAYGRDLVETSTVESIGLIAVITSAQRPAFERQIGGPILDRGNDGLEPADERPVYYPVRIVVPETAATRAVVGFDILADATRGSAALEARDTGRTVLTEPVRATSDGQVSFFVVKALYRPEMALDTTQQRREAHVGFVTTVYSGADLTDTVMNTLPASTRFTVRDGDALLATTSDAPSGGVSREVDVNGRTWTVQVQDRRGVDRDLQWSVAAFAALLAAGLIILFRRSEAHDAHARQSARVIGRTADVAQALAAAGTVEEVDAVIREQLASVLGAQAASIGVVDHDRGVLRLGPSVGAHPGIDEPSAEVSLDVRRPLTEAVRTAEPVLLRSLDDWRAHAPEEIVAAAASSGLVSTACLPLEDRLGRVAGTLAISWDHEVDFDGPTRDTLRTLSELCEYTLDRARSTDEAAREATQLAQLAAQLAAAARISDVLDILVSAASSPVDATATSVGLIDAEAGVLRTHHGPGVDENLRQRFSDPPLDAPLAFTDAARTGVSVLVGTHEAFVARYPDSAGATTGLGFGARAALPLRGSDGTVVGAIVHAWPGPRTFDETLVSTLTTIADMAGQALERTGLSEAEHRLVTTLQDSVLVPLPPSDDLDIAARYLPAADDIGMGGDWYEGIALDDHRYALIIGDVAGHGITAVGDMAQLRAVIGALVRLGITPDEVFAQATDLLQAAARTPTASALLLLVDTAAGTLTYSAAGHPPPIVRGSDGEGRVLDDGRQPILGVPVTAVALARADFPPGSVLVAYTDGLIEVRGEAIDISVERLRTQVAAAPGTQAEVIADHLLHCCLAGREPDDDVALVVVAHRRPC
jgi:CHASE1-domain containing sensor protein/transcriptional regulator with GAF, ATPase, and Fis domain